MLKFVHYIRLSAFAFFVAGTLSGIDVALFVPEPYDSLPHAPAGQLSALSDTDRQRYHAAFESERAHRLADSDALLAQAATPLLKGHVLAQRYLNPNYKSTYAELFDWMRHYNDHPEAGDIYRLALARRTAGAEAPAEPQVARARKLTPGGAKSMLASYGHHWPAGLAAFRRHDMAGAALHFEALSKEDSLPSPDRAAAYFWAYRAESALGNSEAALHYVTLAGNESPGFYSMLAREVTGRHAADVSSSHLGIQSVRSLMGEMGVLRAIALKEVGQDALAENEISSLFEDSDEAGRKQLFLLASMLKLPGAEMRMVLQYARENGDGGEAFYPIPHWSPTAGYRIEPALLFAIMRQESGFNPNAHSASGAQGVMQLMPATAHAMARGMHLPSRSIAPSLSMSLGQNYLEHLMDTPFIGDNLVLMTAAYNAGPGNVSVWRRTLHCENDPLLFIESVPFSETRDYVVRVMGNYWIYSELLGAHDAVSLSALARGDWPRYEGSDKQLASMLNHLGMD